MSKKISAIQKDVVHKICSGQVILNLATAVKELIENSLDAGATNIEIRFKQYGSELIEVSDNGKGIHPDDFEALALKHHTSKISDFSDLVDVQTFGFRGEALSSLCAVSEMTVKTRHASETCGAKLTFDRMGILQKNEPFPRQVGTTVSLTNLFSSLPVRQKEFLRNLKKEFIKTSQLLSAYCLIATNVKITCVNQTKKVGRTTFLSTQESKSIRDSISCVFGPKQLTNLFEITNMLPSEEILSEFGVDDSSISSKGFSLQGFVSSCEHGCGRSSCDRQFYYINSRPCDPVKIAKLTNEVYHRYNQHQFPFVVLNLLVPKESVDINVTPDKRLIFLENEKFLLAFVQSSLMKTFENVPSVYKINTPVPLSSTNIVDNGGEGRNSSGNRLFLQLDKWKHSIDSRGQQNRAVGLKRPNMEHSVHSLAHKQLKLDHLFKRNENEHGSRVANISVTMADVVSAESEELGTLSEFEKTMDNEEHSSTDQMNVLMHNAQIIDVSTGISNEPIILQEDLRADHDKELMKNEQLFERYEEETLISPKCSQNTLAETELVNCEDAPLKRTDFAFRSDLSVSLPDSSGKCAYQPHLKSTNKKSDEKILAEPYVTAECTVFDDMEPVQNQKTRKCATIVEASITSLRESLQRSHERRTVSVTPANKFYTHIDPNKNDVAEEELKREISKSMFSQMKIVGQFNLGFIIAKLENDLFIIDQHASDEKYNFETLQRCTSLKSQKLVVPQNLDLTTTNECILIDNVDVLNKNGFEFSIDMKAEPTKKVKLTSIPVSHNWQFGKDDIEEMLFMLQDAPNTLCRPSRIRAMFASRACRKSVMIGTPLSISDMRKLVNNMGTIEQPWNCPHGRPTMRHLVNLSLLG